MGDPFLNPLDRVERCGIRDRDENPFLTGKHLCWMVGDMLKITLPLVTFMAKNGKGRSPMSFSQVVRSQWFASATGIQAWGPTPSSGRTDRGERRHEVDDSRLLSVFSRFWRSDVRLFRSLYIDG